MLIPESLVAYYYHIMIVVCLFLDFFSSSFSFLYFSVDLVVLVWSNTRHDCRLFFFGNNFNQRVCETRSWAQWAFSMSQVGNQSRFQHVFFFNCQSLLNIISLMYLLSSPHNNNLNELSSFTGFGHMVGSMHIVFPFFLFFFVCLFVWWWATKRAREF